jgi:hypothetical protein
MLRCVCCRDKLRNLRLAHSTSCGGISLILVKRWCSKVLIRWPAPAGAAAVIQRPGEGPEYMCTDGVGAGVAKPDLLYIRQLV